MASFPKLLATTLACFLACSASAQDPALSKEEQKMLTQLRKQWKASGMGEMTPEQEQVMLRNFRETSAGAFGSILGLQNAARSAGGLFGRMPEPEPAPAVVQAAATDPVDKAELARQLQAMDAAGPFVVFERRKDGFSINGKPYLDADGAITDFGADGVSGAVSYIVDTGNGSALVKHLNVHAGGSPLLVGTLGSRGDQVSYLGKDGSTAGGAFAKPTSRGLAIIRNGSLVTIDFRSGTVTPVPVPEGFHIAEFQNGDVGGTRHVLVERDKQEGDTGDKLKEAVVGLGSLFGKDTRSDYALLNIDTGESIPLTISSDRNTVGVASECRRQNGLVNRCGKWTSYDSVYQPDGRPNYSHYFWSLSWQSTSSGPVAVAIESRLSEVNVIRLSDGKRANAFKRGMGIQYFTTETQGDGKLKLVAYWSFKGHPIEDVSTLF